MNILDLLKSFFEKRGDSVLGVDIGSSAIKVVELQKKSGTAVLRAYGELSLGRYAGVEIGRATNLPAEKLGEAMSDLLREAKTTTKNCGMAVPLSASLISIMELPSLPEKELAMMIPIEARKYIPVPIAEVNLDWWILPDEPKIEEANLSRGEYPKSKVQKMSVKTEVLIAAIHNEVLRKFEAIARYSSLEPGFFEIEIFSTMRGVLDGNSETVMIVDMGAAATKLDIVERGIVRASHTINRGSQDITLGLSQSLGISVKEAEERKRKEGVSIVNAGGGTRGVADNVLSYIFSEANRSLLNFERKYGRTVSKTVLSGGGANLKNLLQFAKGYFEVPLERADPFRKVVAPAFISDILSGTGPEFAVAIGVALRRLGEG